MTVPNIFFWMEKRKAVQELRPWLMYGSCDCCGDTMTEKGDVLINKPRAVGKSEAAPAPKITERYCETCKILLDAKR